MYHVITSGRHFLSFWGPITAESRSQKEHRAQRGESRAHKEYLIDVYDRANNMRGELFRNILYYYAILFII